MGGVHSSESIPALAGKNRKIPTPAKVGESLERFRASSALRFARKPACKRYRLQSILYELLEWELSFDGSSEQVWIVPMHAWQVWQFTPTESVTQMQQLIREKIAMNGIPQLTVKELKRRIDAGEEIFILDVREPWEYKIAQIGGTLIPQNEVPRRLSEIDRNREVIVHCHSGVRSQRVAEFLKQSGYSRVANLAGGIAAWSDQIDSSVPKY
jgi:rhodanese-related sulfurtransferase